VLVNPFKGLQTRCTIGISRHSKTVSRKLAQYRPAMRPKSQASSTGRSCSRQHHGENNTIKDDALEHGYSKI